MFRRLRLRAFWLSRQFVVIARGVDWLVLMRMMLLG